MSCRGSSKSRQRFSNNVKGDFATSTDWTTQKQAPVFCDCEASGLDGFPIEIGLAFAGAKTGVIISEDYLIRPPADWPVEKTWDESSEVLHGISFLRPTTEGRPVWNIARRMNQALAGWELFSDSPLDKSWLTRIFNAAGLDPAFTIRRMDAEVMIAALAMSRGLDAATYALARSNAALLEPRIHPAGPDARYLATLLAQFLNAF